MKDRSHNQRLHLPSRILFFETEKNAETLHSDHFSYRTIARPSGGQYKEKGSRFLGFAFPVDSEVEIRAHLDFIQKKYFDARHHCFAWMLGPEHKLFRAANDGEPNHSAGDPILGQIRSKDLTNVLVVVVRYFGGVKLGVGGLITAYKSAAAQTLNNSEIIEVEMTDIVTIVYDYMATPEVMRLVKEFDVHIQQQKLEAQCELKGKYKLKDRNRFFEKLELMIARGIKVKFT